MPSLQKTPWTAALQTHTLTPACKRAEFFLFCLHTHTHRTAILSYMQHSLGLPTGPKLSVSLVESLFSSQPAGNPQKHNALNRMGYKGDGLKIWGNSLAMTEAVTITGSLRCLMPNGPSRARLTGQLPAETQRTLCQFTIIRPFVQQHSTNMPLFTDLWIIQLEQNAMTHFWSKSHYQGEEAFSRRYVFLSTEDKSLPPQRKL